MTVFALGSSILLLLTTGLLYLRFSAEVGRAIEQALRDRAADVALDVREGNEQVRPGEPFVVLLDANGTVIDATVSLAPRNPLLSARELARARDGEVVVDRRRVTGLGERGRLLARPVRAPDGHTVVVVVGESLEAATRASERLGLLLATASPLLIGAIAGSGWVLAGAALRPVRRLTEEADAISLLEDGRRLPELPGDDEITHLGRILNAMLDRIQVLLAHERAFVDDASHELRTPLSILRGELELALTDASDEEAVTEALASALQEAERLSRLTEDLLVLARADRGQLTARAEPVDLLEAARRASARYELAGPPPVAVDGEKAVIAGDPLLFDRILGNLLDNARRHAVGRVQVTVGTADGWACLTVADDGPGFPDSLLPVALDRFTRSDSVRGRDGGGSGLGLAIVADLVRGQGGAIVVGNGGTLGGGLVEVRVPLAAPARPRPAVAAAG